MVTYNKLWKLLIDKDMNKTDLKEASASASTLWHVWARINPSHLRVLKKSVRL